MISPRSFFGVVGRRFSPLKTTSTSFLPILVTSIAFSDVMRNEKLSA